jgi:hypothetical protein
MIKACNLAFLLCFFPIQMAAQTDSIEWFPDTWVKTLPLHWERTIKGISIPDLSKEALLHTFFPGSKDIWGYATDAEDVQNLRLWTCADCPKLRFKPMMFESDSDFFEFPYDRNFTQLIQDDTFKDNNGQYYRLLSFSSQEDFPGSGRHVYGILGMALLQTQADQSWKVLDFDPALDANGMYMRANAPQSILYAKDGNLLFMTDHRHPCGPPMTDYYPCFADKVIYAFRSGTLAKILEIDDVSCRNFGTSSAKGSEWDSKLSLEKSDSSFPDLYVKRTGNLYFDEIEGFDYTLLPQKVKALVRVGKNIQFSYEARYRFVDGKYELINDWAK